MNEALLKAICNPVRLKIITCLGAKEKTVNELISTCGLAQSAVSQHLLKLKKAGILKDTKKGREVMYSVTDKNFTKISKDILNFSLKKGK